MKEAKKKQWKTPKLVKLAEGDERKERLKEVLQIESE